MIGRLSKSSEIGWSETCFVSFMLFYNNMVWICYGTLYVSWLPLVCTRLSQAFKRLLDTWLGIGTNWYHKSLWCTLMSNTHMDVILWSVCYFCANCTSYYIALLICPALTLGSKCTELFHAALNKRYLLAHQPSTFYAMLAVLVPRVPVPC